MAGKIITSSLPTCKLAPLLFPLQPCRYFSSPAGCKNGAACVFSHDPHAAAAAAAGGAGTADAAAAMVPAKKARHGGHAAAAAGAAGDGGDGSVVHRRVERTVVPVMVTDAPKPNDVHCVIDVSGSMAGSRINAAKAALKALFESLQDKDGVSLHAFGSSVRALLPMANKKYQPTFEAMVDELTAADGRTRLWDALVYGAKITKESYDWGKRRAATKGKKWVPHLQRLVVLTDGEDTASEATLEQAIEALDYRNKKDVPHTRIFIIAVGEAMHSEGLARLASSLKHVEIIAAADAAAIGEAFKKVRRRMVELVTETIVTERVVVSTSSTTKATVGGREVDAALLASYHGIGLSGAAHGGAGAGGAAAAAAGGHAHGYSGAKLAPPVMRGAAVPAAGHHAAAAGGAGHKGRAPAGKAAAAPAPTYGMGGAAAAAAVPTAPAYADKHYPLYHPTTLAWSPAGPGPYTNRCMDWAREVCQPWFEAKIARLTCMTQRVRCPADPEIRRVASMLPPHMAARINMDPPAPAGETAAA